MTPEDSEAAGSGGRASESVVLTDAERHHLLRLLRDNMEEGSYYGNHCQYWDRTVRLIAKLDTEQPPSPERQRYAEKTTPDDSAGTERRKLTPPQKIMRAARRGTGLRLSADEVWSMSRDEAIRALAENDDNDET